MGYDRFLVNRKPIRYQEFLIKFEIIVPNTRGNAIVDLLQKEFEEKGTEHLETNVCFKQQLEGKNMKYAFTENQLKSILGLSLVVGH